MRPLMVGLLLCSLLGCGEGLPDRSTQAPDIDGVCFIADPGEHPLRAGEIRTMRIGAAHDYDLTGSLIDTPAARPPAPLIQIA